MDILNSGSFVPLDNKERMEQLAFTAKTLATEVSRAKGFQSSGQTDHQLGLEMWKGAEYVCRAHEEANIKNIFLSKFLATLREIGKQNASQPRPPQMQGTNSPTVRPHGQVAPQVTTTTLATPTGPTAFSEPSSFSALALPQEPGKPADEYLGVVSDDAEIATDRPSYADECKPECEAEIVVMNSGSEIESPDTEPVRSVTSQVAEPGDQQQPTASDINDLSTTEDSGFPEVQVTEEAAGASVPTPDATPTIGSIVLSDKEPYNFDSCTVTAVIQLLPEKEGVRKCVVSVRSHDFAPRISISEVSVGGLHDEINDRLNNAIGQYTTNLPVLASEELKKRKPTTRKRASKAENKPAKAVTTSKPEEAATIPPATPNEAEEAKDQQNLFAS